MISQLTTLPLHVGVINLQSVRDYHYLSSCNWWSKPLPSNIRMPYSPQGLECNLEDNLCRLTLAFATLEDHKRRLRSQTL